MSSPVPSFAAPPPPHPTPRDPLGAVLRALRPMAVTVLVFAAVAAGAAVAWKLVTVLPTETRQSGGAGMDEAQLRQIFAADGWFMVISAVCGLALGLAVELFRRGNAMARVLAVAAGGLLASWVMARIGLVIGPPDPDTVLASLADGATVPLRLDVISRSAYLVWPAASLIGLLLVLLLRPRHDEYVFDGPHPPYGEPPGPLYGEPYGQGDGQRHDRQPGT